MTDGANRICFDSQGVATEATGLHCPAIWFGGGRIGVKVAQYGAIAELNYYGLQHRQRKGFFKVTEHSPYLRVFCPYVVLDGRAYQLEMSETQVYPAGYLSRMEIPEEGVALAHSLVVLNETVMYRVEILKNAHALSWSLRLSLHAHTRQTPEGRTWGEWNHETLPGNVALEVVDKVHPRKRKVGGQLALMGFEVDIRKQPDGPTETPTWIGVVSETDVTYRRFRSTRQHFDSAPTQGATATMSVLFGHDRDAFVARADQLETRGFALGDAMVQHWNRRLEEMPRIHLNRPTAESFFRQCGLLTEMLMPEDLPGAMRASVGHYWVWGWDTMVYCDSYLLAGQTEFVRDALELYRRTAHPEFGIGHEFSERMELCLPQALAAQGLYLNMLYQYHAFTGEDTVLREYYPFAKLIFDRTLAQARSEGLFRGLALFPDFPSYAGQVGKDGDLSVFNNGIFYQAARAMEVMAALVGDEATARAAAEAWTLHEAAFRNFFWDPERGYWYDSLDSFTMAPRKSYPAQAILWVNTFARELVAGREDACAEFFEQHLAIRGGIRMYPRWDPAFNGDGNQLGQYYPVGQDLCFVKLMSTNGRQELLRRWLDWITAFWGQYVVPEGLTLEAENDGPHRPDCPGGKQPFCAKAWHVGMVCGIAGIDWDTAGLTLGPGLDESVSLQRLRIRGREISFRSHGEGLYFKSICVNDKPIQGTCKLSWDELPKGSLSIRVERTTLRPQAPVIVAADGGALHDISTGEAEVEATLSAPATVRVWFLSPGLPKVSWRGAPVEATCDAATGRGSVRISPEEGHLDGVLRIEV